MEERIEKDEEEMKPCPFCATRLVRTNKNGLTRNNRTVSLWKHEVTIIKRTGEACPLSNMIFLSDEFNERPIEEELTDANEQLKAQILMMKRLEWEGKGSAVK